MGDLIAIASGILSDASRSVEVRAQNIANVATPGYKRRVDFAWAAALGADAATARQRDAGVDFTNGKLVETGSPYDLAISGDGFFVVRTPAGARLMSRDGQFTRDAEGRLVDARGAALQADGGDLVLRGDGIEVTASGVVLERGEPVARLDIVEVADRLAMVQAEGGMFSAPDEVMAPADSPAVRQGMVEMSNVATAAEMVSVMAALRRAEAGQRIAAVYDDLMGRAINNFGQV